MDDHGTEKDRHERRSQLGLGIGVLIAILLVYSSGISMWTLMFGILVGAIVGAYVGAGLDIRGFMCDLLKRGHTMLDKHAIKKEEPDDAE